MYFYLLAATYSAVSKKVSDFCKRTNMVFLSIPKLFLSFVAMMLFLILVIMTFNHLIATREPMYTTLQEDGTDQSGAWRGKCEQI